MSSQIHSKRTPCPAVAAAVSGLEPTSPIWISPAAMAFMMSAPVSYIFHTMR